MAVVLSNSTAASAPGLLLERKPVITNPVRLRMISRFVQEKRCARVRCSVYGETSSHAGII